MIVVVGESLVDLVPQDGERLRAHLGGGPFNTARALGRLRRPVSFLGAMSTDPLGARLLSALIADGVSIDTVVETDAPTTLALASIAESGSASYNFYVADTAASRLTPDQAVDALPDDLDAVCAGSLGLVLEPIAAAVTAVVEASAARGALVLIDPNIRASLITGRRAYLDRLHRALAATHVVKASVEDLDWLAPDEPPAAAARELLRHGPAVALVTRGGDGALIVTPEEELEVPAPPVAVVDTIGAGDAFSAGFLASWHERRLSRSALSDLDVVAQAVRVAVLVASRTCERAGASPPYLDEVREAF